MARFAETGCCGASGIPRRSWCLAAARFRRGRNRHPDVQEIKKPCQRGGFG
jgi:hypothetical protein